jgi:hypothetical protein
MKSFLLAGGAAAGLGLLMSKQFKRKKKEEEISVPSYLKPLVVIGGEKLIALISTDSVWSELCDRLSEFYPIAKEEFKSFLEAVGGVVAFKVAMQVNENETKLGTPRMFRKKLHAVVESVRLMRYVVEDKCSTLLDDFDEVASDIQRTHDDEAYNMLLESWKLH